MLIISQNDQLRELLDRTILERSNQLSKYFYVDHFGDQAAVELESNVANSQLPVLARQVKLAS